ncbi:MAG: glycosyltransferase family 39 protein [Acidobacteriota bacterium]|nr:glycosyltransferase family 39 protein [Acidobacteriota bacterium]
MERSSGAGVGNPAGIARASARGELIVVLFAVAIFLTSIISPPSLMDDVDAVQAQIARNMLQSGDWVTARLDGVAYLEKSPLKYWMIAVCFRIFGVHDWAARIPIALSAILLCWITTRFTSWAIGPKAGFHAGLSLATCVGLFLFTRVLIPDVVLTLTITVAMWAFLRALDPELDAEEKGARPWALLFWASMAAGLLLKGLIATVFPIATGLIYVLLTRQPRRAWKRLTPLSGILVFLAIAAPWHVLATIRNPPYLDFTMHSEAGSYRGFFWFYFMNEHVLRFLNLRYPRDYNTVPRLYFWLFHLLWLFPWSVYLPAVAKLDFRAPDRASRARLLALCWIGFVLGFFTLSTTQEYYSMPCYPAFALLLGSALAGGSAWLRVGTRLAATVAAIAFLAIAILLFEVRSLPAPGDISVALTQHPNVYTLSLGHMADLTFQAFAYLRLPLAIAAVAVSIGAAGGFFLRGSAAYLSLALMMLIFFQAARLALVAFDPYLGSHALATALIHAPKGRLIVDDQYYSFSSVFFYSNRTALLLNGRLNNLDYGSYAPRAPKVFIGDADFERLWKSGERYYLVADGLAVRRL